MTSLLNIFDSTRNRKSIPKSWCGLWTDTKGKKVLIDYQKSDLYFVTIMDLNGEPFEIEFLNKSKTATKELIGRFTTDTNENPILQIEAGDKGVGPTYNMYFLTVNENGKPILAKNSDSLEKIIIRPNVGMGLYDDWEDDLGVPWAFPLEDLKKEQIINNV